ncbi:hypothetical protein [Streptomyces anulatus]|uniref:hypothetical protein n=1 Tax=Streptomyces anulatus TaxID=1892 RepID=UPI001D18DF77|nr:hypothetical protein [Streptomyces anulatus]
MSDRAWDRKTQQLIERLHKGAELETGLARGPYGIGGAICGRYECRYCGQDLVARNLSPTSPRRAHFSHQSSEECPASRGRRSRTDLEDQLVVDLRDALVRAWPGVPVDVVLVRDPEAGDEGASAASGQPPAIVVRGTEQTLVVEHVPTLPGVDRIRARQRAVRARFGPGAAHVWFLAKDPMQFARCGTLQVKPRGLDKAVHTTIAPTAEQLAVIAASGGVYWLDGQQVHVPYGVHDFVHTPEKGEDWNFRDWRRDWHKDWRISHPLPAPDATRWGLVPLSLHQLTRTKATFSLREAHEVMQGLEDVQRARWRRRRADARELHTSRQARPAPPPPTPAPSPPRPAVPQARNDAPKAAQREKPSPPPAPAGADVPDAGTQAPAPPTASAQPSVGHDVQPGGPAIPPLPRHPPLLPAALPDGAEPGRRRGLRTVLRQLLRGKQK